MKWTYKRLFWFGTVAVSDAIMLICMSFLLGNERYFHLNKIIQKTDIICQVGLILTIFLTGLQIYLALNPSVSGFLTGLLSSIFGILLLIVPIVYIPINTRTSLIGDPGEGKWQILFDSLELDDIQRKLNCCGFNTTDDHPGRNGMCHRINVTVWPCKQAMIEKSIKYWEGTLWFFVITEVLYVASAVAAVLLMRSNPDDEFSPDAETVLAQGLL